jgi:hypothetical protein
MAISAPIEFGSLPNVPFLIRVGVEGGILEVAVEGAVDQTSLPVLLDEIRHAAGLGEMLDQAVNQPAASRRLSVDLTGSARVEPQALDELMGLVHEFEGHDVTVRIVGGQ